MKSDSYTPAIPLEELVALARIHGPEGLAPVSAETAHRVVEQVLCPCIRGEACVCEAIADEFLRLAKQFRRQRDRNNPQGYRPWKERWENEGGSIVDRESNGRS